MKVAIQNVTTLTETAVLPHSTVLVENGRFSQISTNAPIPDCHIIDGSGLTLTAGFIDLQLNGGFGHDFTHDPTSIWRVAKQLPQYGVTSFLPTIVTSPLETVAKAQAVLAAGPPDGFLGTTPLGLHVEGPFLNPRKKGAHNADFLQLPDATAVSDWTPNRHIRLVTVAPELPNAHRLIKALTEQGVVVSAGHSMATLAEAQAGFSAGIRYGTHLFNAMPPLHHREPGLVGALLADERVMIGIIPDGVHVHPDLLRMVWRAVGNGRLSIVTDSMAAMGMPPGTYNLATYQVHVDEEKSMLADGTLAGSIVTMDRAIRDAISYTGHSLHEVLAAVTKNPANLLNMPKIGRVEVGKQADFVLLSKELEVEATFIKGRCAFAKQSLF